MITRAQSSTLRYLIHKAKEGNDLMKRIIIFLLNSSDELSEQVALSLVEGEQGYTAEEIEAAAYSMEAMTSSNYSLHLSEVMFLMNTKMHFSVHYGKLREDGDLDTVGMFPGRPRHDAEGEAAGKLHPEGALMRYTFWLAEKSYGHSSEVKQLFTTREELEQIDVRAGMLYEDMFKRSEAIMAGSD